MIFLKAFLVGGLICAVGQILIDWTKLTPARILVLFVTLGVLLGAIGLYEPLCWRRERRKPWPARACSVC